MRVLVTGTSGFIGFHLANLLLDEGHEVVGIDNFNPYYAVVIKRRRHEILSKRPGFRGVEMDLLDYVRLRDVVRAEKIERFCHLAAQAGVRHSLKHPFDYQKANLEVFLNVLETVRHAGIDRLVYASSSSVYGGNTKLPFSEDDAVDNPISLYAATKRANELMAHTYSHLYGFTTVGLRFFTVYGPWGRPDMAMWLFAEAITHGKPITVFNHGKMKRDFTYVDDIVAGVRSCITGTGLDKYEIFNIGNHRSEDLMEMIGMLAADLGIEPKMNLEPIQPGDVPATYASIDRIQSKLGFEPRTRIREGVSKFVEWFKAHPEITEEVYRTRN